MTEPLINPRTWHIGAIDSRGGGAIQRLYVRETLGEPIDIIAEDSRKAERKAGD